MYDSMDTKHRAKIHCPVIHTLSYFIVWWYGSWMVTLEEGHAVKGAVGKI